MDDNKEKQLINHTTYNHQRTIVKSLLKHFVFNGCQDRRRAPSQKHTAMRMKDPYTKTQDRRRAPSQRHTAMRMYFC
jgi:hypothetical protein